MANFSEEDKVFYVCLSEDCILFNFFNWDIILVDNILIYLEFFEFGFEKYLFDSYSSFLGYFLSFVENSSFMYIMYR